MLGYLLLWFVDYAVWTPEVVRYSVVVLGVPVFATLILV